MSALESDGLIPLWIEIKVSRDLHKAPKNKIAHRTQLVNNNNLLVKVQQLFRIYI